jgi:hypothetical protein
MGSGKLQKARDIGRAVLAIGIDLKNVSVTRSSGVSDTAEDGASLALIDRVSNQGDSVWRATGGRVKNARAFAGATVIHEYARQVLFKDRTHYGINCMFVVVNGNDYARVKHPALQTAAVRWYACRLAR